MNEDKSDRKRRPLNDNHAPGPSVTPPEASPPPVKAKRELADDLIMGIRFFSRLPTGDRPHERPDLNRIAMALPFASLVIGLPPSAILLGTSLLGLPNFFAAGIAVAVAVVISGAMAEDAIADAADGLFGGHSAERRLEIMKDSRHGTYGVAALCLFLLLRVGALAGMAAIQPFSAAFIWLASTMLARSGALWLTVALPPARPGGVSASAGRVGRPAFFMGAIFALILGLVLGAPGAGLVGFLTAVVLVAAIAWCGTKVCQRLVGGQTGDLIGALQALLEIAALTGFMLFV